MTSDQDVRSRIADELDSFRVTANVQIRHGREPIEVAEDGAARIIAVVREAMMSEEAVESAMEIAGNGFIDTPEDMRRVLKFTAKNVLGEGAADDQ